MIAFEKSSIKCPNWASSGFMKIRHVKKIKPTKLYDGERKNKKMIFDALLTLILGFVTLIIKHKIHFCDNFS